MRQWKAFQADIFFKFDLEIDLLTVTLMCNHFEDKCNQLKHLEKHTIDNKFVKIGPWNPEICHIISMVGGILHLVEKQG